MTQMYMQTNKRNGKAANYKPSATLFIKKMVTTASPPSVGGNDGVPAVANKTHETDGVTTASPPSVGGNDGVLAVANTTHETDGVS